MHEKGGDIRGDLRKMFKIMKEVDKMGTVQFFSRVDCLEQVP